MILRALVLAILPHFRPGADRAAESAVVDAIATVGGEMSEEELALMTTYAWLESGAQAHPRAFSWDARAGKSCGPWQEPCAFVQHASLVEQARYWLREL